MYDFLSRDVRLRGGEVAEKDRWPPTAPASCHPEIIEDWWESDGRLVEMREERVLY